MKYSMACSCGDTMEKEAASREEAVTSFKEMMNAGAIAVHMAEKHPGQPAMSVEECHAQIERDVKEVV